ncbi:hypothetical protein [Pantoea agglomerans]|uniref:hypothetical protein n=1 Tax=Enterobacter agglomerans TaxID=549 RepID=UPI00320A1281
MSQQNTNVKVKGAAKGPRNLSKVLKKKEKINLSDIQGSIVGNCDEVAAYLKHNYPCGVFTVIVWTLEEIKDLAQAEGLSLSDQIAGEVLFDIAVNEIHEHGQNEESALSYVFSSKN